MGARRTIPVELPRPHLESANAVRREPASRARRTGVGRRRPMGRVHRPAAAHGLPAALGRCADRPHSRRDRGARARFPQGAQRPHDFQRINIYTAAPVGPRRHVGLSGDADSDHRRLPVPLRLLRHHPVQRRLHATQDHRIRARRAGGPARARPPRRRVHRRRQFRRQPGSHRADPARDDRIPAAARLSVFVLHAGQPRPRLGEARASPAAHEAGWLRAGLPRHREPRSGGAQGHEQEAERQSGHRAHRRHDSGGGNRGDGGLHLRRR